MNLFVKKIPRGVIYHKVTESIGYLLQSLFMPLDRQDEIKRFEEAFARYCERDYCVAFPFARTAIYFALKNLDLPKGSEIIMPPITITGDSSGQNAWRKARTSAPTRRSTPFTMWPPRARPRATCPRP